MSTNRHQIRVVILTVSLAFLSCNSNNKKREPARRELPEVTNLNSLKQSAFAITLESSIEANKNIIYAPAFMYAWDKVKQELKSPITDNDKSSSDFKLINETSSHQN